MLYTMKCEEIITCSLFACFPSFCLLCITVQEKNLLVFTFIGLLWTVLLYMLFYMD